MLIRYKTNLYSNVKNCFSTFANQNNNLNIIYEENKDVCAVKLITKIDDKSIGFYYFFGDSQVHMIEDNHVYVLTTNAEFLYNKIGYFVEQFIKKSKVN